MKIYILPVNGKLKPDRAPFRYPTHNHDYGIEQDFLKFLGRNPQLLTEHPQAADWHYLPVFWTRWHLHHDYGRRDLNALQEMVGQSILEDEKTFTICQYAEGPKIKMGNTVVFLASRSSEKGLDAPLLCKPIRPPWLFSPTKRYIACFLGRKDTHPIRKMMFELLSARKDAYLFDGNKGIKFYRKKMLQSYIALCPRGYGGSSFRFFEAMQLGLVPMFIGKPDTRPFKSLIDWDQCSLYLPNVEELHKSLDKWDSDIKRLTEMGNAAKKVWQTLQYGKWPNYVIQELEEIV